MSLLSILSPTMQVLLPVFLQQLGIMPVVALQLVHLFLVPLPQQIMVMQELREQQQLAEVVVLQRECELS
jgi:hypothetical protein